MKNFIAVFAFFVFADLNAMSIEKERTSNKTNLVKYAPKKVPATKYNVAKLNISILQIKEWRIFDFKDNTNRHKIFYNKLGFVNKNNENNDGKKHPIYRYIRTNMDQNSIKKILKDIYPDQQIETEFCSIYTAF